METLLTGAGVVLVIVYLSYLAIAYHIKCWWGAHYFVPALKIEQGKQTEILWECPYCGKTEPMK